MSTSLHRRRGITLLEVLISMGILTIGLVSVLSLVPAGRSQALKAGAIDRTSALALNAAADFITRGGARPAGWLSATGTFAVFDPLDTSGFWTTPGLGSFLIRLKTDAVTTASSTSSLVASGTSVMDILARSEDDIRYSTDAVGPDDPPAALWSSGGAAGRHVFDGNFSYLATLGDTSATWNPGDYKSLTIVTFNRREAYLAPVQLTADATNRLWDVDMANVPSGMSLKDLIRPGAMVLYRDSTALRWLRVLLAADATAPAAPTAWKVSVTCEQFDPDPTAPGSRMYVFPGASGSLQIPVRLEGTSAWND
jgi:Tfp pilus assembly protein PilV